MDLWHIVISIFPVVCVQGDEYKSVLSNFSADLQYVPDLIVREGTKVTLTCPKRAQRLVDITVANAQTRGRDPRILVDGSILIGIPSKYSFYETDNSTYAFTINRISRHDEGTYRCSQRPSIRARVITVIYSPSGSSPQCSSNYKSPIIFYDEITDYFLFNCSTERGKPPVTTNIYVNEQEVTTDLETRTDKDNIFTTYSLSRHFNDTLQHSEFVCNVTQQLPSPYDDYQGSCSFGPLHILPGFSLSVSPSNHTVREERNITLTCTSNVSGVKITWINIPSENYTVNTDYNRSSVLTILLFKQVSSGVVFIECIGSYGNRTVTANTTLLLMFNMEGHEDKDYKEHGSDNLTKLLIIIVVSLNICVATLLVVQFIRRNKRKNKGKPNEPPAVDSRLEKPSTSNRHEEQTLTTREESNINNANNTAICQQYDAMCDNIIYEPALSENITEFVEDEKIKSCEKRDPCFKVCNYAFGDDHIVCENVIYQSVSYANKEGRNTTDLEF